MPLRRRGVRRGGDETGGCVGQTVLSPNIRRLVGALFIVVACLASAAGGAIPGLLRRQASDAEKAAVNDAEPWRLATGRNAPEDNDLASRQPPHKTGTSLRDNERGPQQKRFLAEEDGDQDRPAAAAGTEEAADSFTDDADSIEEDDPSLRVAPKYMLELYRKFSTDKYSHPIANIVRSFLNINTGVLPIWTTGNRSRVALHTLLFNISSVNRDEEVHLAELRLFAAEKTQRVLVYEVVHHPTAASADGTPSTDHEDDPSRHYELLTTREIHRDHADWETFTITEVVRRWVRTQATVGHVLEVRVDTTRPASGEVDVEEGEGGTAGGEEEGGEEKSAFEPILVVFSNDRKRRKIELRELHEIQSHENGMGEDDPSSPTSSSTSYSSSTSSALTGAEEEEDDDEDDEEEDYEDEDDRDRVRANATVSAEAGRPQEPPGDDRRYPQLVDSLLRASVARPSTPSVPSKRSQPRVKRSLSRNRSRRTRRNSCRRKPMWVDFGDVLWDEWIIEPRGYQAYECTGQCYFPVGDKLTPTKYAMIKSLLHATYPKRVAAVCCVPTKLEPISLLYIDEHGTVTYKYKYDGMVVAECGCR